MVTNKLPTLGINELLEESTARDFFFFFPDDNCRELLG